MELKEVVVKLDEKEVTLKELEEAKTKLQSSQKIIEVSPGVYKTLVRLQE